MSAASNHDPNKPLRGFNIVFPACRVYSTHTATYETVPNYCLHTSLYGTTSQTVHTTTYEYPPVFYTHETSWTTSAQLVHHLTYQSQTRQSAFTINESSYQSTGGLSAVFALHESAYASSGSSTTTFILHETSYGQAVLLLANTRHETSYASSGSASSAFMVHEVGYSSSGSLQAAFVVHDSAWQSASINQASLTNEQTYQSVALTSTTHTVAYWSESFNPTFAVHETRYRSYNTDTQFVLANAYILPDIQLVSAQVTADEDSPYYQCEVELRDSIDYRKFVRDQEFTLRIFNDDYVFVVDSKNLSRSINDAGNLQETVTLSGLSPLCLKASPRAETITKTWDTPTFAKAIVEELLGTVTWNLVNWMIPAYRLSADNADPLTIAQQVVNAAGGLIESQPDGSVVVRHRWPVSITDLSTNVAAILDETMIYSLRESPTQDDLMDRIRILDSNAGYQDRLEYVANELSDGSDNPWSGTLYAYPSPWRDGLRLVTTRGSKIQLGMQTEGTRAIYNHDESVAETITFENGQSSTQYPIALLHSFVWMDSSLGSITYSPYSTTVESTQAGLYQGHSLAQISYTTRYIKVPVNCTPSTNVVEAQFLLVENSHGE